MHTFRWKSIAFACSFSLLSLTNLACDSENEEDSEDESAEHSSHEEGSNSHEIPDEFAGKMNPFEKTDSAAVAAGKMHYDTNCKGCHGESGKGDGPSADGLPEMPPDLTTTHAAEWQDDFLLYVLSDGIGIMPGFKSSLDAEQLWQIVTYVRSLQD